MVLYQGLDVRCSRCEMPFRNGQRYADTPEGPLCKDCLEEIYLSEIYGDDSEYKNCWEFVDDNEDMINCECFIDEYGFYTG